MLLAVDVGNKSVILGLYSGKTLEKYWTVSTELTKTADEYAVLINNLLMINGFSLGQISDLIISSVVPQLVSVFQELGRKYLKLKPLIVGPGTKTGMSISVDNPREVGAGLIVNAVAAYESYGGPVIIVDLGTATAFCVVSGTGEYLGGALAPGIEIAADALYQHAAKLPRIEMLTPKTVVARNTTEAMQAGLLYGFAGQVDYIVNKCKTELSQPVRVVATGTLAKVIAEYCETIDLVDPLLTLTGLRIIYERNR